MVITVKDGEATCSGLNIREALKYNLLMLCLNKVKVCVCVCVLVTVLLNENHLKSANFAQYFVLTFFF